MGISEMINDAIEYILIHIEENVTAESVAEHCHVSRFYFTRIFKQQTGESVYAFIKKKKLEFGRLRDPKPVPSRSTNNWKRDRGGPILR